VHIKILQKPHITVSYIYVHSYVCVLHRAVLNDCYPFFVLITPSQTFFNCPHRFDRPGSRSLKNNLEKNLIRKAWIAWCTTLCRFLGISFFIWPITIKNSSCNQYLKSTKHWVTRVFVKVLFSNSVLFLSNTNKICGEILRK
jgi:hypothetical protein